MQQIFFGKGSLLKMSKVNIVGGCPFDCTEIVHVTDLSFQSKLPVRSITQMCYGIYRRHLEIWRYGDWLVHCGSAFTHDAQSQDLNVCSSPYLCMLSRSCSMWLLSSKGEILAKQSEYCQQNSQQIFNSIMKISFRHQFIDSRIAGIPVSSEGVYLKVEWCKIWSLTWIFV
jgi:hypothetical protein